MTDRFVNRRRVIGVIASVATTGLMGCGGGGTGGGSTGTSPTPTPTPTPPVIPIEPNHTDALVASRNSAQAVDMTAWLAQLQLVITPFGKPATTVYMSQQGRRMDDFVRPSGVGNSGYYRANLSYVIPGLWVALHYSPKAPADNAVHASYVFENQPVSSTTSPSLTRFRTEADADRLSYTVRIIDPLLSVNVTQVIGTGAATSDLQMLKHGQDQRWFVQSRAWPVANLATNITTAVAAGQIFGSALISSGGKSAIASDPDPAPACPPLGSGGYARHFPTTGGRNEIGPNGTAWVNKAIRTKVAADYTDAVKSVLPQFSVPSHAREADGSMALWKTGTGPDGHDNAAKQIQNAYGGSADYSANYFNDVSNGGWNIDTAHRGNGSFGIAAMQGGLDGADPLIIEEAAFVGCSALNVSAAFDRTAWADRGQGDPSTRGSILSMGQGRDLAWNLRDMSAARSLTPSTNSPNWLVPRADYDAVLTATLDVIDGVIALGDARAVLGAVNQMSDALTQSSSTTISPVFDYTLFGTAFAYRATGNARFKTLHVFFMNRRLIDRMLASPLYGFGYYTPLTYGSGPYTPYADWPDYFTRNSQTSTSADPWISFPGPTPGTEGWGDYNIAMYEAALIAKNLVGMSSARLDTLLALYANKWLNNSHVSDANYYGLTAQWTIDTIAH